MIFKIALLCLVANFAASMPYNEVPVQKASYSAPVQQASYSAPVQQASYSAPVQQATYSAPVQQASYSAPVQQASYSAPVQQASYSAPAAPNGYGVQQQEYRDPVKDMPNTCKTGYVQPIWEGYHVTETYCRCPDGSYGHSCQEGYNNPCNGYSSQYHPADSRLSGSYFVECAMNTPFLMKCPKGTIWNQNILVCDWTADATHETYNSYKKQAYEQGSYTAPVSQSSYAAPVSQSSYAAPVSQSSYAAPVSQSSYAAPQASYGAPQAPVKQSTYNLAAYMRYPKYA